MAAPSAKTTYPWYSLDHKHLIGHAGRVTTCWIEAKGQQLLEAIEQWYPPPPEIDEKDTPA